jgi:hypothetical protein
VVAAVRWATGRQLVIRRIVVARQKLHLLILRRAAQAVDVCVPIQRLVVFRAVAVLTGNDYQ